MTRASFPVEAGEAYDRAVSDMGMFDRTFFSRALTDDKLFDALAPELQRRAQVIRDLVNRQVS
jgi:hypothetical protein